MKYAETVDRLIKSNKALLEVLDAFQKDQRRHCAEYVETIAGLTDTITRQEHEIIGLRRLCHDLEASLARLQQLQRPAS